MPAQFVLIAFALVAAGFAFTWRSLLVSWNDFYSSGFLIVPYGFWLAWSRRHEVVGDARPWIAMMGVGLCCSLVWLLGRLGLVQIVHQTMLPLILASWALAVLGRRAWPVTRWATLMFLLGIPLLTVFVPVLQSMTVGANRVLLAAWGLRAEIAGRFITIPEGVFEVADGCSGAAFFTAAISLAAIYVTMLRTSRQAALVIVGSAVVLALVTNWLRVFALILVGHWSNMTHPLLIDHGWFGWVIFAAIQPLWLWLSAKAEKRWPVAESGEPTRATGPQLHADWRVVAGTSMACLAGPALALGLQLRPRAASPANLPELGSLALAPVDARSDTSRWQPSSIEGQRHLQTVVAAGDAHVQVDRVVFTAPSGTQELVSSDRHLGDSVQVLRDEVFSPADNPVHLVRQALVRDGRRHRLVWYWFRVAGVSTTHPLQAKLLEIPAGVAGSAPSEFVALSAACGARDCANAAQALRRVFTQR